MIPTMAIDITHLMAPFGWATAVAVVGALVVTVAMAVSERRRDARRARGTSVVLVGARAIRLSAVSTRRRHESPAPSAYAEGRLG